MVQVDDDVVVNVSIGVEGARGIQERPIHHSDQERPDKLREEKKENNKYKMRTTKVE